MSMCRVNGGHPIIKNSAGLRNTYPGNIQGGEIILLNDNLTSNDMGACLLLELFHILTVLLEQ